MKKILIAAICVLALLVGVIVVDAIISNKEGDTVPVVSQYTDGDVRKTTVVNLPTKDITSTDQVQFSMPLHYLEEKYRNDLDLFCKEHNYISCTIDEATQTFTVTMKASTHDFMLVNIGIQTVGTLGDALDTGKYPFLKKLGGYNDNFSEITVVVDGNAYNAAADKESFLAFVAGCGIYYQLYTTSNDYSCKVIVKDDATGEAIDAKLFRQNNSGAVS